MEVTLHSSLLKRSYPFYFPPRGRLKTARVAWQASSIMLCGELKLCSELELELELELKSKFTGIVSSGKESLVVHEFRSPSIS